MQGVEDYESGSEFVTLKLTRTDGNTEVREPEMWVTTAVCMIVHSTE
jgi:hypothetical protein